MKKEIEMKIFLLDSSIYISNLNASDQFHLKTRDFIQKLEKQSEEIEIIVPILIILEVANVLKKTPEEILTFFADSKIIEFNLDLVQKVIPFFKSINLKTSDAVIAGTAKIYGAELVSWDMKLIKEAKKLVKAYTPD